MMFFTKTKLLVLLSAALIAAAVPAFAEEAKKELGGVTPNFLLQTWMLNDTTTAASAKPGFLIRRAELRFSGSPVESARWFIMIDSAKAITGAGDNKVLQDFGVAFKPCPDFEIVAGQFKTLTSSESLEKAAELILPERSMGARVYGDRRETGAALLFKHSALQLGAMVSNTTGTNQLDNQGAKDLSLRADYEIMDGIKVGAFTLANAFSYSAVTANPISGGTGANVRAEMGDLLVSVEGMLGSAVNASGNVSNNAFQSTVAYTLMEKWQPVLRFETYIPDTNLADRATAETVGLNYYISKHQAKIQAAYMFMNNMTFAGNKQTWAGGAAAGGGSVFILAFQGAI